MNSNHRVNIIRIKEILPHNNADTLGIVQIEGYQVVVKKNDFKVGDLAVYIQPDSIVPQTEPFKFIWSSRSADENGNVADNKRRITVRKFRGEWSEGLLMPISSFSGGLVHGPEMCYGWVKEGDDVAETLSIKHYEEPEPGVNIQGKGRAQYKTWPPRSLKGFFYWFMYKIGWDLNGQLGGDYTKSPKDAPPVYGVESLKNYPYVFTGGEPVIVTEKIHGSNARFMFDGKKMWVGSHKLWKSDKSICIWRRALKEIPWIEEFCRNWPNHTLYGEVCPTQPGYSYGTEEGKVQFFAFDLRLPEGTYVSKEDLYKLSEIQNRVPVVYIGPYDSAKMKELAEGNSLVPGAKHIREGVVITSTTERDVRGAGRAQLKLKSMAFLTKEIK